jgi:prepilin-type processing-associated H-X9-DG protein
MPNKDLPPERRLSWYVGDWYNIYDVQIELHIDYKSAWDDDTNLVPMVSNISFDKRPLGSVRFWLCPSNPNQAPAGLPEFTHYVGVAGVGTDAALFASAAFPNAGVFGFDRSTRRSEILNSTETTLLVIEVAKGNGPWTAGGPPTVRGLDPQRMPYLGPGGQIGGPHRGCANAVFVDGNVRAIDESISPEVFEMMATIADRKELNYSP